MTRGALPRFLPRSLLLLLLLSAGCRPSGDGRQAAVLGSNRPPVLLISIDTLRADHLGCYGYHRPTSPRLDRLAADSVLFEQVINPGGATLPVHLSMMTSLPPRVHGIFAQSPRRLGEGRITLAEQLSAAGYHTAAFTDGGYVSGYLGFDQGFELFDDDGGHLQVILPKALRWLEERRQQPFFLFLHTYDVHSGDAKLPYDSPDDYRRLFSARYHGSFDGCAGERCGSQLLSWLNDELRAGKQQRVLGPEELAYLVDLYDGGIRHADTEIGRLLDRLQQLGLYHRSLIIVTSDHGEEFLEHGLLLHHQNYEEEARVPLLVKLPNDAHAGSRSSALVTTVDLMPTILELAGVEPNDQVWGHSLLPLIAGTGSGRPYVSMASGPQKLRTDRWSLVLKRRQPIGLYDLLEDPKETTNLLDQHPQVVEQLLQLELQTRQQECAARQAFEAGRPLQPATELPQETVDSLRALGYLQ